MILAWTVLGVCSATASALMMAACAPAGAALRFIHQITIPELPFDSMRDHGIWGTLRSATGAGLREAARWPWEWKWPRKGWYAALAILVVPVGGYLAGAMAPVIVMELFTPPSQEPGQFDGFIWHGAQLAGFAGAVIGTYLWVSGLAFVARPAHPRKFGRPPLVFPDGLSDEVRDYLALNVYWRSRLIFGCVFAAVYPWWFLASLAASSPGNSAGTGQSPALVVTLAVTLAMMAPTAIPVVLVSRAIERHVVHAKVCEELCGVLMPRPLAGAAPGRSAQGSGTRPAGPDTEGFFIDPFGSLRDRLALIAADLDDAAALTDRKQKPGLSAHPAATLMRAVAKAVRQYLGNRQSLRDTIPDDMRGMLATTVVLFAAHHDPAVYDRLTVQVKAFNLAGQVQAFDADGNPAVEPSGKPPGRLARLTGQVFTGIPNVSLTAKNIATLVVIALAVVLVLRHAVTIEQFMQYLK